MKIMEDCRVRPGQKVDLKDWDPRGTPGYKDGKVSSIEDLKKLGEKLDRMQELLYAERERGFLVVLQGMDTSGKDGVIRHVFGNVSPQNIRVANFKKPTPEELDHDFLWRIHSQAPKKGELVIFNRSHYEDVVAVHVHKLISDKRIEKRFKHIVHFEKMLASEGITILKLFLHISKSEQKERLEERIKDPVKRWKFNENDLVERALWPKYQKAYEESIEKTSTDFAPWFIIPSDHKWFRNLAAASIIVKALENLDLKIPKVRLDPEKIKFL